LFGDQYQGLNNLFTLIIVVFIISAWSNILQTGLIARREFDSHAKNRLLLLMLMLVFTISGVFHGGVVGVALGMAFAHTGQVIFLYWLLFGNRAQSGSAKKGIDLV
jgi:O-antigen/teichoic acid export membrane protein